jgi:hypothetical protein
MEINAYKCQDTDGSEASLKKKRRREFVPTRKVGAYALHCIGANFSVGASSRLRVFRKLASGAYLKGLTFPKDLRQRGTFGGP